MHRPADDRDAAVVPLRPGPRGAWLRAVRRRLAGDRGAASVELAVLFPVVLLLIVTVIQAALWFYARSIALGAAQEGAREGRVQPASAGRAQAAAEDFIDQTGEGLLTGSQVDVAATPESIEVSVTGTSISLFPGLSGWAITQTARGAVERPTP